jgi:hypothetical protein
MEKVRGVVFQPVADVSRPWIRDRFPQTGDAEDLAVIGAACMTGG